MINYSEEELKKIELNFMRSYSITLALLLEEKISENSQSSILVNNLIKIEFYTRNQRNKN